jgi:hypothetical protein
MVRRLTVGYACSPPAGHPAYSPASPLLRLSHHVVRVLTVGYACTPALVCRGASKWGCGNQRLRALARAISPVLKPRKVTIKRGKSCQVVSGGKLRNSATSLSSSSSVNGRGWFQVEVSGNHCGLSQRRRSAVRRTKGQAKGCRLT